MNEQKSQPQNNKQQSATNDNRQPFFRQLITFIKVWPALILAMLRQPHTAIDKIPNQGSLAQPLTYVIASYSIAAIFVTPFAGMFIEILLQMLILSMLTLFVSGYAFDFILGKLNSRP